MSAAAGACTRSVPGVPPVCSRCLASAQLRSSRARPWPARAPSLPPLPSPAGSARCSSSWACRWGCCPRRAPAPAASRPPPATSRTPPVGGRRVRARTARTLPCAQWPAWRRRRVTLAVRSCVCAGVLHPPVLAGPAFPAALAPWGVRVFYCPSNEYCYYSLLQPTTWPSRTCLTTQPAAPMKW